MYFKRPILNEQLECKNCANGWQAVDATPQEISFGGDSSLPTYGAYMMGPASLKMIKHNRDPVCRNQTSKYGCFDSQFAVGETNANILMYTKDFQSGVLNSNNFELYPKIVVISFHAVFQRIHLEIILLPLGCKFQRRRRVKFPILFKRE